MRSVASCVGASPLRLRLCRRRWVRTTPLRLYSGLDASRPVSLAGSIAAETIQMLYALVVWFMRSLEFALRAHTKVWRLGNRTVHPPHIRHALELSGGARLNKCVRFEGLLGR